MNMYVRNLGIAALAAFALSSVVNALTITPSSGVLNTSRWEGNQTSQNEIDAAIAPFLGSSTELYTQNVGGAESGVLAGSYETTFANTPLDPEDATITYVGGPIVPPTAFALVKDGSAIPSWYLFNLTLLGWDGTQTLEFENFWPDQGAISHISLYGGAPTVPDGGATLLLLGSTLLGIAFIQRKLFC